MRVMLSPILRQTAMLNACVFLSVSMALAFPPAKKNGAIRYPRRGGCLRFPARMGNLPAVPAFP